MHKLLQVIQKINHGRRHQSLTVFNHLKDGFEEVAKVQDSATESLKQHSPTATMLKPGQLLRYQKAIIKRAIIDWQRNGDDMRIIKTFFIGTIISLTPVVAYATNNATQSERELREECSYEITGMRECLLKKQQASEAKLKKANKKAQQKLTKWDEDPEYVKAAIKKLATAEKAFIAYREEQCQFAAALGGGAIGNALDMRRFACITELNNRRAEQLHSAISDIPLK